MQLFAEYMIDDVLYLVLSSAAGAALSPKDAQAVLNALPMYRAPTVLAAVLSRGFLEHRPKLAVKHGHALALLPHYPPYILADDLQTTLKAAGSTGDLPTAKLLWQLVGPATAGHTDFWVGESGFLTKAVMNGHLLVVQWFSHEARTANIQIHWTLHCQFNFAAAEGRTETAHWAIAQGLIKGISGQTALLSTQLGDTSLVEWWIMTQDSKRAAMDALSDTRLLARVSNKGLLRTLDWWWASSGSKLPEPDSLTRIVDAALCGRTLVVVEWWWARFLEHHTPEHTFGSLLEIGQFNCPEILDWHWQKFHEKPDYFACPLERHKYPHGVIFSIAHRKTLPILQWAVDKCTELGSQKLVLRHAFINSCLRHGDVGALDLVLHSAKVLGVKWSQAIVACAIKISSDLHCGELPPQDLGCSSKLSNAAALDGVNVLEWWHAHQLPACKVDWQWVCIKSIEYNSRRVQMWLMDHVALFMPKSEEDHQQFMAECIPALKWAAPFTLDFFNTIFTNLDPPISIPMSAYHCATSLYWFCALTHATVASLLPSKPRIFSSLFEGEDTNALEWWLQVHLAAGHPLHFPSADKLDEIYVHNTDLHAWVFDVVVTRKVPVLVESDSGMVPYKEVPWNYS
ncbi:hypothetical protein BC828DRAFT_429321 [Blastocladiella britannica]|nr:hypothetical protein BC828DRAFT_429321 [Blastocladiella britannica]